MGNANDPQHHTEVTRVSGRRTLAELTAHRQKYQAVCGCGWEGQVRDTWAAADDDGSAHHLAEIPDDMPGSSQS